MMREMPLCRLYGEPPYRGIVLHGGPGAPGCAAGLCRGLSELGGVAEHLQRSHEVNGLLEEIRELVDQWADGRAVIVGHSFGAWLALLFAEKYPERTEKIILIGCGPLDEAYLPLLIENRQRRRSEGISDTDHFYALPGSGGDMLYFDEAQHISLMNEISDMRRSGELASRARRVSCPVCAIHGAFDPHPVAGVSEPMAEMKRFSIAILERCGHDPWKEKYAREEFFALMKKMLQAG